MAISGAIFWPLFRLQSLTVVIFQTKSSQISLYIVFPLWTSISTTFHAALRQAWRNVNVQLYSMIFLKYMLTEYKQVMSDK